MYQFLDAINKINFPKEFLDVADNVRNDCEKFEGMDFTDSSKIKDYIK